MRARLLGLLIFLVTLSGCGPERTITFDPKATARNVYETCIYTYRFTPGTDAHSQCIMQLSESRSQEMRRTMDTLYSLGGRCVTSGQGVITCR